MYMVGQYILIIFMVFIFFVFLKRIFKHMPVLILYIPSIIFASFGLLIIGRYLYLTWTGVFALCDADPNCMNEDWSILIGVFMMVISLIAAGIATIGKRNKAKKRIEERF